MEVMRKAVEDVVVVMVAEANKARKVRCHQVVAPSSTRTIFLTRAFFEAYRIGTTITIKRPAKRYRPRLRLCYSRATTQKNMTLEETRFLHEYRMKGNCSGR